jgi:hypothetical protein
LSVIVVSNLWEGERLLVDLRSVYLYGGISITSRVHILFDLDGSLEVFLLQRRAELVNLRVKFLLQFMLLRIFLDLDFGLGKLLFLVFFNSIVFLLLSKFFIGYLLISGNFLLLLFLFGKSLFLLLLGFGSSFLLLGLLLRL